MPTLESRLTALENSNRRLKLTLALAALGALSLCALGSTQPEPATPPTSTASYPKVIRARKFILEDKRGETRATLGPRSNGEPALTLFDPEGLRRCMITLDKDHNGAIVFRDQNDSPRLALSFDEADQPGMALCGKFNERQVFLYAGDDGTPSLEFFDGNDTHRATLGISRDGFAGMVIRDGVGRRRLGVAVENDGTAGLTIRDKKGTLRLFLEGAAEGQSSLSLSDEQGRFRAMLSAPNRGPGWLSMLNKEGHTAWTTIYPVSDDEAEDKKP